MEFKLQNECGIISVSTICEGSANCTILNVLEKGEQRVMKIQSIKPYQRNSMCIANEFEITKLLNAVDHPNIIKVYNFQAYPDFQYFTMEKCKYDLLHFMLNDQEGLSLPQIRTIFRQIVSAVSHAHLNNVYHLDLKLENILIGEDGYIKLADFGCSQKAQNNINGFYYNNGYQNNNGFFTSDQGTPYFMPPEIVNLRAVPKMFREPYSGEKADSFALGVILFCLVFKLHPFSTASAKDPIYSQIINGNFAGLWNSQKSYLATINENEQQEITSLIESMLQNNPIQRSSIQNIIKSQFLTDIDQATEQQISQYFNAKTIGSTNS